MSTNTPNLNLAQPQMTDKVAVTIPALANNMQLIDTAITDLRSSRTADEANIAANTTAIATVNSGGLDTRYYTQTQVSSMLNNATKTATIQAGTSFPTGTFTDGQVFWRTDLMQMFAWSVLLNTWMPVEPGNTTSHASSLSGVWNFENDVYSSRGLLATFTRATAANDPSTLATVASGKPRLTKGGKYGNGILIEEGTTNLVYNSDFETVTSTATVFSDGLTSGAAWTTKSGSFTFAAGGATSGATGSFMTAGNAAWKPLTGSGGQNLAITEQATFTTSTTVAQTDSNGRLRLYVDANNYYGAYLDATGANFVLSKTVAGTVTQLATVAQAITASTAYTITLSLDKNGALTAKLYAGTGTSTLLQTLTATDTSLTGGFLIGVGGDAGVVVSGAQVTAPWADTWTIAGDQRVAWALTTTNPISGTHSVSAVGLSGVQAEIYSSSMTLTTSTQYTASAYLATVGMGAGGAYLSVGMGSQYSGTKVTGTTSTSRSVITQTSSGTGGRIYLYINDVGTATFDAVQMEQKSYQTSFLANNSTSSTATRNAETLTVPSSVLNSAAGTVNVWAYEDGVTRQGFVFDTNGGRPFFLQKNVGYYQVYVNNTFLGNVTQSAVGFHMYTFSWSGTTIKFYVDGALKATYTSSAVPNFAGTTMLSIGSSYVNTLQWNNIIDDLAIFNRALTDAEVAALYASPVPLNDLYRANTWTRIPNRPSSLVRQNLFRGSFSTTSATNVQPTATTAGVFQFKYNAAEWANTNGFMIEPYFATTTGGTAYVGLWDVTGAAAVSGSEVLSASASNSSIRSGTFTLTDGHTYTFYARTSNASYAANVYGVDLLTILN